MYAKIPLHYKGAVLDWNLVTSRPFENSEFTAVCETSWRWCELCGMVCCFLFEAAIGRCMLVIKGWTCWKQYSVRLWSLNDAHLALRTLKCGLRIPHQITPPPAARTVNKRLDGSMFSVCINWMLPQKSKFIKPGKIFPVFYCMILVSQCNM